MAAASSLVVTAVATPLIGFFDLANIVMLYLLAVVLAAVRLGRGPAVVAATVNVAAFDFFFVPPRFSFAVSDVQYLLTFAVMLAVGLLIGQLTAGLRYAARVAASRERRAQASFELSRDLASALLAEPVAETGRAAVQRLFGGDALVLVTDSADKLVLPASLPPDLDPSIADWAFRNAQAAGLATATLSANAWHYLPLKAPMRIRGLLALKPAHPNWLLIPEQVQQLETLARQIAIALERVHYVEVAQGALVQMESERLRNTLLAAISHDVRTPLTALIGLAESLRRSQPGLVGEQRETAQAIETQARALNALVNNLLDMARLQSGQLRLRTEWQSVEEVVGSAIRAARYGLSGKQVRTLIDPGLPLVEFDAALIERMLVNLLENAAKYGAEPIEVAAQAGPETLVITVRDHGPGLPASLKGREDMLFDKFTRGSAESATPGVGLGLAIAKAVVLAHGGQIEAGNAPDGGAQFTITLPRRPAPQDPPP
jgi:two-component system sensor histidine kinase KdpD